jgi:hypothetical protein
VLESAEKHGGTAAARRLGGVSGDGCDLPREKGVVKKEANGDRETKSEREPHRVRLPGFLIEEEVGLGDAIKRVTYAMGIQPCGGCEQRAAALNRWMHFTR